MQQLWLVFVGGGIGSMARYGLSKVITRSFIAVIPWGTLSVNLLGCLLIGIALGMIERYRLPDSWVLLLATGFCGGFTTFSSFSYEHYLLFKSESYSALIVYAFLSLFWGFASVFLGVYLVKQLP